MESCSVQISRAQLSSGSDLYGVVKVVSANAFDGALRVGVLALGVVESGWTMKCHTAAKLQSNASHQCILPREKACHNKHKPDQRVSDIFADYTDYVPQRVD